MANINLLPWREQLREDRKRDFLLALSAVLALAAGLLLLADRYVNSAIEQQQARNAFLQEQIAKVDRELGEIRELREQKAALSERMAVIQDLQGTRPVIVRLFDELVRTLPEGVYYNTVSRVGDSIRLEGVAESNSKVSALMRELDASPWFARPDLQQVTAANNARGSSEASGPHNEFLLSVNITRPQQDQPDL